MLQGIYRLIVIPVIFIGITFFIILLEVFTRPGPQLSGPACPHGWTSHLGNCYYYSKERENWTSSRNFCLSFNADLFIFNSSQLKDFVMPYKDEAPYWIGLRRNPGQPWKWTNGEIPDLEVIGNQGDCAFLNHTSPANSQDCRRAQYFICQKPLIFSRSQKLGEMGYKEWLGLFLVGLTFWKAVF